MIPLMAVAPQNPVEAKVNGIVVAGTQFSSGDVRLLIEPAQGRFVISKGPGKNSLASMDGATGEVAMPDGSVWNTRSADRHSLSYRAIRDGFGRGVEITVRHGTGARELRQKFWMYRDRPEVLTRLDAIGIGSTNRVTPIAGAQARSQSAPYANRLEVPYDNDGYNRYHSDGRDGRSHGVTALYDGAGHGVVIGSIDHELWKSGIAFGKDGRLDAIAGMTENGRDKAPHGTIAGDEIRSPRFSIGFSDDWRGGMERYGELNAIVKPALAWKGGVPFGWNSWSAHKAKLKNEDVIAATDFIANDLPTFRNGRTAYVNMDSFWDNLTQTQRKAFVGRAHGAGLKAGTYWTPFVAWGELDSGVGGDIPYRYRDLALKDAKGEPLPKLDGGWPLDPTHPGTLARIDRQMKEFVEEGYDFVKLDFTTHGALEGRHHNPKVRTGNEAYAIGMQRIVADLAPKRIGRPFFISLSIAPLFPHGFGHSRRISCDAFADIGASEYMLNSATYGWWTENRLYRFNDPDHTVVYQAMDEGPTSEAEGLTRINASLVAGGMLLEGDALGHPEAQSRVKRLFTNPAVLALARRAKAFRPLDVATGERASEVFVLRDGGRTYIGAFNYDREKPLSREVSLRGLNLAGRFLVTDLWTGTKREVADSVTFTLPPRSSTLVVLEKRP